MSDLGTAAVLAALIFALAGIVKGVTGMGLPTVAMGLLSLSMAPAEAASLLILPSLITNVWQFAAGPHRARLLRRIWPMLIAICLATWGAAGLLTGGASAAQAAAALGAALMLYAALSLAKLRISVSRHAEVWLSPLMGAATGIVTGATGVFVIPAVPFLQALGLDTEELVQALGLSFTVSTIALAAGLASRDAFHLGAGEASLLCTVPALAGMFFGQWIRTLLNPTTFRRLFLIGLLALGADLALRSLI